MPNGKIERGRLHEREEGEKEIVRQRERKGERVRQRKGIWR